MLISAWLTAVRNRLIQTRSPVKRRNTVRAEARLEDSLESRALLAGPSLVAVRPNIGAFLTPGETRNIAPRELTLQFNPGQQIDASNNRLFNNSPIEVMRSGRDGSFADGNEIPVTLGYVGLGATAEDVVIRFAENHPDDYYRITIRGSGGNPLRNVNLENFVSGTSSPDGTFDFRLNLAPQVRAIVPQPMMRNVDGSLTQQRNTIVVYFNEDTLDTASAQNVNFYRLLYTRSTSENTDDVLHLPTSVAYSPVSNTATLTFAQPIDQLSGNGTYRLRIGTDEAIPLPPVSTSFSEIFTSSFGTTGSNLATVTIEPLVSIDGSPITLQFTSSALSTQGVPAVSVNGRAISVTLDSTGGTTAAQLFWALNLHPVTSNLVRTRISGNPDSSLATGTLPALFSFSDPGSSYSASFDLGALSAQSRVISGQILSRAYPFDFPGNGDEPGHRDINVPRETHLELPLDQDSQITTLYYNFQRNYGFNPQGQALANLITENQKQRAREVFSLYARHLGVQFVETANQGFTIVTGDLRAIDASIITGAGGVTGFFSRALNLAIMDNAEVWDDSYAGSWFTTCMHQVGHLLGMGHAYDLPDLTVMGGFDGPTVQTTTAEPDFPGDADIVHGQALYRPESRDIDLYRFTLPNAGQLTAETIAERLNDSSLLDTVIRLYRQNPDGSRTAIAANDDYFSEDSMLALDLEAGTYFIGVSASGNDAYDPTINDSGMNGTTQGRYELRLVFRPNAANSIVDSALNQPAQRFDGDQDGVAGGVFNYWFRAVDPSRLRVVDKTNFASPGIPNLYRTISAAFAAAQPGDVVRIVGNGGTDGDVSTKVDNLPYQIGLDDSGFELADGGTMDIPADVAVMIDAGAIIKFQDAVVGVGSSSVTVDRGGATLQVLGTPFQDVTLTSWRDETIAGDTTPTPTTPRPGNWGGIVFRRDVDTSQGRLNYELKGQFLDYVAFSSMLYGGGKMQVDSVEQIVNPITMITARPSIYNNFITLSEDSALSADPDSFEETTFSAPAFQAVAFTPDYGRIGPDIYGNRLINNSNNGLFVRIQTAAGEPTRQMTVAGRFDDKDIVHIISENLVVRGTPGGPFLEVDAPPVVLVTVTPQAGNGTLAAGTYNYRIVYVDASGNQSPPSLVTRSATVATANSSILLGNLPPAAAPYTSRRLFRSTDAGTGPYTLIANLNASATTYTDNGTTLTGILDETLAGRNRARLDASLVVDPELIVKLEGSRIEVGMGAQLVIESEGGREVIITSRLDDRYGIGGTFDTNNDDRLGATETAPSRANGTGMWGGIYLAPGSTASIDYALVTFGGSVIPTEGNFAGFNVIEAHQADLRITNSIFEENRDGTGGTAPAGRFGRTANASGTLFARGSQPILINNIFRDNSGPALSINANAMTTGLQADSGRVTGLSRTFSGYDHNQGPLIDRNLMGRNAINGLVVRGETLTTETIWDDTDIVHVLLNEIVIPNFHTYGGLRLNSDPDASLVVKLGTNAGFTAAGKPLDIDDRIGGILQIVGQPFFPVILTAVADDSVGSGFDLAGLPLKDTNGNGPSSGAPGAWRSILISQYAHDRNVEVYNEREVVTVTAPGTNATARIAEFLGDLGRQNFRIRNPDGTTTIQKTSDDNLRLGFEVHGTINAPGDVDVYSFKATAGSEVWIDIDRTTHALDTVVELVSSTGQIIALSDNSLDESVNPSLLFKNSTNLQANSLHKSQYISDDLYGTNQKDAGFRVVLPGTVGSTGTFHVRVRSSNIDSLSPTANRADLTDTSKVFNGLTSGSYRLQIRLQETDEVPGTTVRYADIRFATNGIEVYGQPVHSPLSGEYTESLLPNDGPQSSGQQNVGNILNTDRAAVAIAGRISAPTDVDFYRFSVTYDDIQQIPGHTNPDRFASVIFDVDYADGMSRGNLQAHIFDAETNRLILTARDSGISDDRGGPLEGADMDDLSRGSVGALDPYIGPFELPEGDYYLVVAPNSMLPAVLNQTLVANPVSTLVRLEPLPSVTRIFDAHFGANAISTPPKYQFADGEEGQNVIQYHLGDIPLFASNGAAVTTRNSFTGVRTTTLNSSPIGNHDEIQMRQDGELFTWVFNSATDGGASIYTRLHTGTGAPTAIGDDGILTFNFDANGNVVSSNAGTLVTAFTYVNPNDNGGRMVATRGDAPAFGYSTNILYRFNVRTGAAISRTGSLRTGNARAAGPAGTDVVEEAILPTQGNGIISGIASRDGANYFAVDNTGRLYHYVVGGGTATTIATVRYRVDRLDPTSAFAQFTGLTFGPTTVENGAYATTLFASDAAGNLYAIAALPDPAAGIAFGDELPFFYDGQTRVPIGQQIGITFGTLQRNLWGTTANRANDIDHILNTSIDGTRNEAGGGASLYFGNQAAGATVGNKNDLGRLVTDPDVFNYDFPGGAHGTFLSNTFSLEGYSATDKPTLYFTYFVQTDSNDYIPGQRPQSDAIRVYVGDGTNWVLTATNDSFRGPLPGDDEQDLGPGGVTTYPTQQSLPDVVEIFDEGSPVWRQARVDLSSFAGRSDLRLRFEFASSGSVNVGSVFTVGEELFARPGSRLRDGQSFILEGCNQFEIDLGYTLIVPNFEQITEGETIQIDVTDPATSSTESFTFEFDKAGDGVAATSILVSIAPGMSSSEIARKLENAIIETALGGISAFTQLRGHRNGNRLNLTRHPVDEPIATDNITLAQSTGAGLLVEGAPGVTPGTTAVTIHSTMSPNQVAEAIKVSLASHLLPAATYRESEFNNAPDPLLATNLETLAWSALPNNTISLNDPNPLPHITIIGASDPFGGTDFYRFVVPDPGTGSPVRVIVDLDGTAETFNSLLRIVDAAGNTIVENINGGVLDIGSNFASASYLDELLTPGEYYVQVGVPPFLSGAAPSQIYTLHLSVEGHATDEVGAEALVVPRFNIKGSGDLVRIIGHYVTNQGPMGLTTRLPGDSFGGYGTSSPSLRGMNNRFEGFYIDDIVLGFAERGEMVTGAPANTNFIQNPEVINTDSFTSNPYLDILTGDYDVEIRRAADYASFVQGSPVPNPAFRSIDTNDRFTEQQSIRIPSAAELRDGQTFSVSDGISTVTFEYEDERLLDGVAPGHQPILFNPARAAVIDPRYETVAHLTGDSAATIAARVRNAINSTQVQGLLNLRAGLSDGTEDSSQFSTSSIVNLYGTAIVTLTDGVKTPASDAMPLGVFGRLAPLNNTAGSSTLFTFRNTTPLIDPNTGFPEQIRSIRIQLPGGQKFDPISILGGTGDGPTISPISDFDNPTFTSLDAKNPRVPQFTFSPDFDILTIDFSSVVTSSQTGPGFERGDQLVFGIDIDYLTEPVYALGTTVEVEFSTTRTVTALLVPGRTTADLGVLRPIDDTSNVIFHTGYGDQNQFRDQGQLLIASNFVSDSLNWGILSDAAPRTGGFNPPGTGALTHAGPVRNLREPNLNRWVPGIVIANNVIVQSGTGGILFSGDVPPGANDTVGPVPVGRIINNTIVGNPNSPVGFGIRVEQNASPTLLNNVVADLATGIFVDGSSQALGTVIGGTLYRGNGINATTGSIGTGTFPIVLSSTDPLFVDQSRRNYYPAPLSQVIDSSIDALNDRTPFITVRDPLGIGVSPIKTPSEDVYGQPRGDDPDVNTPAAQGANVFKDRGAIDRVDFFRPTSFFSTPLDQSPLDLDSALDTVWLNTPGTVRELIITLRDAGIGVDDGRVFLDGSQFKLYMDDGVKQATDLPDLPNGTIITEGLLTLGVDYVFVYNSVSNEVIFRSTTAFPFERKYRIEVDNNDGTTDSVDGVRDLAGNYLAPNRADGTTQFTLLLTDGINDPPVNGVPVAQTVDEDTDLVFSAADGNAVSVSDADVWLGNNILRVTLTAANGTITLSRTTNLTFTVGDGSADSTMTFTGAVDMINLALEGMIFRGTQDYFGAASITITTNDLGGFTGPPTPPAAPQQDTDVITITVLPVNDPPSFTLPAIVVNSTEDQGQVTVPGFMSGISAGPPNETESISALFDWTVEGAWSAVPLSFFSVAPAISLDPTNPSTFGQLTFTTAPDVNGKAIVRVWLKDGHPTDSLESAKQTFEIIVSAVNDAPVITLNPLLNISGGVVQIGSNEDGPQVNTTLSNTFAPGPATALDEITTQTVSFNTRNLQTVSGNLTFSTLNITTAAVLQYVSAANAAGAAILEAVAVDDGPATAPDVNTSLPVAIRITVTEINDTPVAVAGPFVIDDGDDLLLDASRSSDVDIPVFQAALTYAWDIDNNGSFETSFANAVSGTPDKFSVSFAYLAGLGVTSPSSRTIRLRVTDPASASNITSTTLQTLIVDYGDAPATFGTNRADSGAAHTISNGLHMGALVDAERNGVPGLVANGDDTTGTADEDGVAFPVPLEAGAVGLMNYVDITSTGAGFVDVWLDLNNSGVFDEADRLTSSSGFAVTAGSNRFFFVMPAGTALGERTMRFRISSVGGLTPTGRTGDGEVEDYTVNIAPLSTPVKPAINRPIDITPEDGIRPQTTDTTPLIGWTAHSENFYYTLVIVSNATSQTVYTKSNITFNFQEVGAQQPDMSILPLPDGTYTATLTPFNRVDAAGESSTYEFDVVRVRVTDPTGDIPTSTPIVRWNHVPETKAYRVTVRSLSTGSIVEQTEFDTLGRPIPNEYQVAVNLPIGRYQVSVIAIDQAGLAGTPSDPLNFQVRTAPVVTGPAANVSNPRPTITWQGVSGAVNYEVEIFNRTDNVLVRRASGVVGTSYTLPADLTLGSYSVRVRGFNTFGDSSFFSSERVFGYSPAITVVSPGGRLPDNTPTFQISAVPAADRYELYVFEDFGTGVEVFRETNLRTPVYTRNIPLPLGRYRYFINAVNEAAVGSTSGDFTARSVDFRVTISERPTVVNPPATTFLMRPEFTWTVPLGAGANPVNDVWVNKIEGGVSRVYLRANGVVGTKYTPDIDLILGTYQVWIRSYSAVDPATVSDYSIPKTFRITTAPNLVAPTGRIPTTTPTLTWEGVQGAQTYRVFLSSLTGGGTRLYDVSNINALSFTVPQPLGLGSYRYWVMATSAFGDTSNWSVPKDFQVVAAPVLSGPSSSTFDSTPSFSWSRLGAATSYDLRIDQVLPTSVVVGFRMFTTGSVTSLTVPDNQALPNGTYRARIRARSADTQGDYSVMLEFSVGGRPIVNAIPPSSNQQPTITWGIVDGASSYEIFISNTIDPTKALVRVAGLTVPRFTPTTPLAQGNLYRVWVRAINSATSLYGPWSNPVDFLISDAAEIAPAGEASGNWILTATQDILESQLNEFSISMLPSRIGKSQPIEPAPLAPEAADMPLQSKQQTPESGNIELAAGQPVETDEVLSGWSQEAWWDHSGNSLPAAPTLIPPAAPAPQAEVKTERQSASAGLLGAILGLATLRRRRRNDESEG